MWAPSFCLGSWPAVKASLSWMVDKWQGSDGYVMDDGTERPAPMVAMGRLRGHPKPLIRDALLGRALKGHVRRVRSRTRGLLELAFGYEEVGWKIKCDIMERSPRCHGSHKATRLRWYQCHVLSFNRDCPFILLFIVFAEVVCFLFFHMFLNCLSMAFGIKPWIYILFVKELCYIYFFLMLLKL